MVGREYMYVHIQTTFTADGERMVSLKRGAYILWIAVKSKGVGNQGDDGTRRKDEEGKVGRV